MSVRVEVVSEFERLQALSGQWSRLLDGGSNITPFQSPHWLLTWWPHLGSGEIRTPVFWNGDVMVGLIPCFHHVWEGALQSTLMGSGITDYLEPCIARRFEQEILLHLGTHLDADRSLQVVNWQDLEFETPLTKLSGVSTLSFETFPDTACSEIPLPKDPEIFWRARSSDLRRNVRRYGSKAEAHGDLGFRVDEEVSPTVLDALFTLHAARWAQRGESGMVVANRSEAFLRDVAQVFSALGCLRLFSLQWGSRIVAVIFGLSYRSKIYGYLSAFDPEHESFGLGRILLSKAIEYAIESGHTAWNFLRGEEPYKRSWGATPIPKCRIIARRR